MRAVSLLIASLLVASALAFLAGVPTAQAATTNISGQLTESAGSTSAFGGGNYRYVQFGNDSAFGVVWGNATHANSIYLVVIKARYLGVGQVYLASNGALVKANEPVKIYTIYASQLQDIVEYRDVTGDGVANYSRTYNSTTKSWSNYVFSTDVGYKLVNLTTNWIAGNVTRTNGTSYRAWTFNLTADNLAYYNITNRAKLTGSLPLVEFTFHLNASLVQEDNVTVPQWNVTVGQVGGHYILASVTKISDLTLASVTTLHYAVKWDQLIQGWAYDHRDNVLNQRRLLLEMGTIVANWVPPDVVAGWSMVHDLGDDGQAHYNTTAGPQVGDNSTGSLPTPRVLASPSVDFGGAWTRISRFGWTTTSSVDNATRNVTAQLVGGFGFWYLDAKGLWYGFVLLMGLNYYGGQQIVHDPTVSTDAVTGITFQSVPSGGNPGLGPYAAVVVGIVILVILVLVAWAMIVRRRKKEEPPVPPQQPPVPPPQ